MESVLRGKHKIIRILGKKGIVIVTKLGTGNGLSPSQQPSITTS